MSFYRFIYYYYCYYNNNFFGVGGGGGGGGQPDPWTLRPFFLGPLGPQFGLKIRGIRGEGGPPLDPSLQEA